VYAYIFELYICLYISSPYLLVFGDDHVIRYMEQRMLQVVLVRHNDRMGLLRDFILLLILLSLILFIL